MSQLSEDESSDSSDEFLVPVDKIDLSSSFFQPLSKKPNPKEAEDARESSDNSDFEYDCASGNVSSADLLVQVMKNLENVQNKNRNLDLCSPTPSTSQEAEQNLIQVKNNDLSREIHDLLLQGESQEVLSKQDDDDIKDDHSEVNEKKDSNIPRADVEIHLPGENLIFNRRTKKQQDLQKVLQSKINQRIRKSQVFIHKVGLLTWISHGFYLNKLANDADLLRVALSLVSSSNYPKDRVDLKYLEKFTRWFRNKFTICEKHKQVTFDKNTLIQRIRETKVYNYIELCLLFVATLRGMGINCRLVISLIPPPLKPKSDQLFQIPTNDSDPKSVQENKNEKISVSKKPAAKRTQSRKKNCKNEKTEGESISPSKVVPKNSQEASKIANLEAKRKAAAILQGSSTIVESKSPDQNKSVHSNVILDEDKKNLSIAGKLSLFKFNPKHKKGRDVKLNETMKSSPVPNENLSKDEYFSTDDEYEEKKPKKRLKNQSMEKQPTKKNPSDIPDKQRRLLSSDEEEIDSVKNVFNVWVEVYVESEESWISVDVLDQKIHCVSEIYRKAGNPVLYVVAWNTAGTLKDVTRRYCPHWLTDTRKKRVEEKWWIDTLSNWKEKRTAVSKAEDEQLLQRELEQPLPKTVGECKGHPLYVLTRHLLKFEALYPPEAVPLGHLKTGEAIYSRHCVHTLYSRETWVRRARVVKPAQEAYKIVKSMPKYDKLSGMKIKDQPLELFGKWQTTPYVPAEAKDGKVPRNEYGNVDLFKMCMLPKGCVYIDLPALNRVARKLNIDCAPACVGFNFGSRGALPAFEGFVVCKEYEDTLREAWEQDQIDAQKRAKEKRHKRIYGNWKKLIKGLLIREKLAAKYNFKEEENDELQAESMHDRNTSQKKVVSTKGKQNVENKSKSSKNNKEEKEIIKFGKKCIFVNASGKSKTNSIIEPDTEKKPGEIDSGNCSRAVLMLEKINEHSSDNHEADSEEDDGKNGTEKETKSSQKRGRLSLKALKNDKKKKCSEGNSDEDSKQKEETKSLIKKPVLSRKAAAVARNNLRKREFMDEDEEDKTEILKKKKDSKNMNDTSSGMKHSDDERRGEEEIESPKGKTEEVTKPALRVSTRVKRSRQEPGNTTKKVKR